MSRNVYFFTDEFKKTTSYITQDDRLQLLLTVFENMKIAADLKLGNAVSNTEKNSRVSTSFQANYGETQIFKSSYRSFLVLMKVKIDRLSDVHERQRQTFRQHA